MCLIVIYLPSTNFLPLLYMSEVSKLPKLVRVIVSLQQNCGHVGSGSHLPAVGRNSVNCCNAVWECFNSFQPSIPSNEWDFQQDRKFVRVESRNLLDLVSSNCKVILKDTWNDSKICLMSVYCFDVISWKSLFGLPRIWSEACNSLSRLWTHGVLRNRANCFWSHFF